jgi:hypothetical protein
MFQELLHFFSFIFCAGGLGVSVMGILLTVHAVTIPLIRHKFQAAYPFLLMILGGLLAAFFGWKGIISIPTPKILEIQAPPDSVIRAEVIRNGQVIHQEEI